MSEISVTLLIIARLNQNGLNVHDLEIFRVSAEDFVLGYKSDLFPKITESSPVITTWS